MRACVAAPPSNADSHHPGIRSWTIIHVLLTIGSLLYDTARPITKFHRMAKLKLFISHSSRLDDVPNKWTSEDHNWKLLEETCAAIKNKYGDRIQVLVDKDGLIPGGDWNHHLNLWLAECHVALIIFSKRAVEKSDWVAKEATILSWRADLDDTFKLIPVTINNELSCDKLSTGYLGTIKIAVNQCIRDIESAQDIVDGLVQALGEPDELADKYPQTPLEVLQGGITKLLSDQTTQQSIIAALESLNCTIPDDGNQSISRFADMLSREMFSVNTQTEARCFKVFETSLNKLTPQPDKDSAEYLFRLIRSLWVDPAAAGKFPKALRHDDVLLMTGFLATLEDTLLGTQCYSLNRCIERAFPGSSDPCIVTVTHTQPLDEIKQSIQDKVLGEGFPTQIPEAQRLAQINNSGTIIFLVVTSTDDSGLPDYRLRKKIRGLNKIYHKIVLVISSAETPQAIPEDLESVDPAINPELEANAYTEERLSRQFIYRKYNIPG